MHSIDYIRAEHQHRGEQARRLIRRRRREPTGVEQLDNPRSYGVSWAEYRTVALGHRLGH